MKNKIIIKNCKVRDSWDIVVIALLGSGNLLGNVNKYLYYRDVNPGDADFGKFVFLSSIEIKLLK